MRSHLVSYARRLGLGLLVSLAVLSLAARATAQSMRFVYDAAGNVIERSVVGGAAPQITNQPRTSIVAPGDIASFSVILSDTRDATYQWRFNGTDITGETSDTLLIDGAASGDQGQYTVVVTNPFGTVTSQAAALLIDTNHNGLPDSWEIANFGMLTSERAGGDADADGSTNLTEFLDGTNPTGVASFRTRLDVTAQGGNVAVVPTKESYDPTESVTLTATPSGAGAFYGWSGDATGTTNPITVSMSANRSVVAHFECAPIPAGALAYFRAEGDAADAIGARRSILQRNDAHITQRDEGGVVGQCVRFRRHDPPPSSR